MKRLTTEDVAAQLHVEAATVCRWASAGRLPGNKVGLRWLFTQDVVDKFVESGASTTTPAPTRRRRRRAA